MYQNYKIKRLNRIIFVVAILILLGGGVFLAFNFLAPASEPVEAVETEYRVSSAQHYYNGSNSNYAAYPYIYSYVYVNCDSLGISSISGPSISLTDPWDNPITSSSSDRQVEWKLSSLNLTINLRGYSWVSTITSFSATWGFTGYYYGGIYGGDLNDAIDLAKSRLGNSTYGGTMTYTRSGNSFTTSASVDDATITSGFWGQHEDGYQYCVLYIDLEKPTNSVRVNSYSLIFNYNGGSGDTSSLTVTYNSAIGTLPGANRTDYIFNGWYIGGTRIYASTVWTYTSSQTAVAQWTFTGYTLTYSVNNDVGGSIVGASTEYGRNTPVTVTASPDEGYIFDHWVLNGTSTTANPLTFTITQNSTLVAYFREVPSIIPTFSGATTTPTYNITQDGENYYLTVYPLDSDSATEYVYSVTIGSREYILSYYRAYIYDTGGANEIIYYVKDDSNIFNMKFEHLFATTRVTINLTTNRPTYQNPPLGGASISGVATQATTGGEARITGADLTETESTVHLSAISYSGYRFTGWTASDGTDLSAYSSSADIPLSLIEGKVITANFASTVSNDINSDTDNTGDNYL